MRRSLTIAAVPLLLGLTGCAADASTDATASGTVSPTSSAKAETATASPTASKSCSPTRDVIVWYRAPGVADSAQVLGNYDLATCESTFQWLQQTSPTGPGYCTEAAWASDNPGYNADATPAKRLKKVQLAIGPAC